MVKLLSVALMNEPGALAHVATTLGKAGINIEAWTGDAHAELGVARLVVSDPDKGLEILREAGHPVQMLQGVKVHLPDEPGQLAKALRELGRAGVNIDLVFGATGSADTGEAIFIVSDVETAKKVLGAE